MNDKKTETVDPVLEFLDGLAEHFETLEISDKKTGKTATIMFRIPARNELEEIHSLGMMSLEARQQHVPDGMVGWIIEFITKCVKITVSIPDFKSMSDDQVLRYLQATGEGVAVDSPIVDVSRRLCGYPKPSGDTSPEDEEAALEAAAELAEAEKEVGELPLP